MSESIATAEVDDAHAASVQVLKKLVGVVKLLDLAELFDGDGKAVDVAVRLTDALVDGEAGKFDGLAEDVGLKGDLFVVAKPFGHLHAAALTDVEKDEARFVWPRAD